MSTLGSFAIALLQIPGLDAPEMTFGEAMVQYWVDGGWMMWPLGACAVVGLVVIVWKLVDLGMKSTSTRKFLRQVDTLFAQRQVNEALALARESDAPVAKILEAGLERQGEGSDRVLKAIENVGLLELAGLERGLIWLATCSTVAPLLGFLGTVMGMIEAFHAIELAGDVEATLVASGIKVALVTTAAGLAIAIPINIAHNYFVARIDGMVIEMEESAQRMIDTLHEMEVAAAE